MKEGPGCRHGSKGPKRGGFQGSAKEDERKLEVHSGYRLPLFPMYQTAPPAKAPHRPSGNW